MSIKRFIFRKSDQRNTDIAGNLIRFAKYTLRDLWDKDDIEVVIQPHRPKHSDPQRRTVFMWCKEVAVELTILTGYRWEKDDVYEVVFKERFMPFDEKVLPDGEVKRIPVGLSSNRATEEVVGKAMDKFWYWAVVEHGWELTDPDPMREAA